MRGVTAAGGRQYRIDGGNGRVKPDRRKTPFDGVWKLACAITLCSIGHTRNHAKTGLEPGCARRQTARMQTVSEPSQTSSPRLIGDPISLRGYRDADADALLALFGDADVTRYWSQEPWTQLQQARDYLDRMRAERRTSEFYQWAIASNADDALIGTMSLFELNRTHRRGMIGYAVLPSMQGRGHASEAMRLMIDFAWNTLDLRRLEADTDPANTPSHRLLQRVGFVHEGSMRDRWFVHGKWHDTAWYGLVRE